MIPPHSELVSPSQLMVLTSDSMTVAKGIRREPTRSFSKMLLKIVLCRFIQ